MVCFHPIKAYFPLSTSTDYYSGEEKRYIKFSLPKYDYAVDFLGGSAYFDYLRVKDSIGLSRPVYVPGLVPTYMDVKLPCGKCLGCHADRARNYATRSIHEYYSDLNLPCSFVTLTFNEDMLRKRDVPYYKSIYRPELTGFIKRLRERVYDKYGVTFRVFGSGEYGEKHQRPHYHLLIYGFGFPDKYEYSFRYFNCKRISYYRSDFLESIWKPAGDSPSYGFSIIGDVNQSSCQYVSGYVADKLDESSSDYYKNNSIDKPFFYVPRKPGLGASYFFKYYKEIFDLGYCHWHNKLKAPIPGYYSDLLKRYFPDRFEVYKLDKLKYMVNNLFVEHKELSEQRLIVREEALKMKYEDYIRSYEQNAFLHNIYYKYISKGYKNALKALKLIDFNFNLEIDDARHSLKKDNIKYNYVFLDAFTPTKCPCLWTIDFLKLLYEHLEDDGMILTYSNSAQVRNAFINAGFIVGKIYSESSKKFTGTIAVKNNSNLEKLICEHKNNKLVKISELSEYDLGLIKTKAGIFYRDENLSLDNEVIIKVHEIEVQNSNLMSSSKFIKEYKKINKGE